MKRSGLSIDIDSKEGFVRIELFLDALQEFRGMLSSLDTGYPEPLVWVITELSVGSAHAAVEPIGNPQAGMVACSAAIRGLVALERGEELPEAFRPALAYVRNLAVIAHRTGASIAIGALDTVKRLTEKTLEAADRLLAQENILEETWGSVEGTIEMVSLRNGLQCNIYDNLTDEKIECRVDESLFEEVRNALGKRIIATGRLKQLAGRVRSMKVLQLIPFSSEEDLPSIDQVTGIAPDITGGLSIQEYIRRLRDEQ
ncbi:MAG: hypothetical protein HPY90_14790 [Syntrophothermus sp.]|uniref:hypothetical protein n=1 Tax=Syntrophothermus sp. TaxID=2736299 RepID=UPI00257F0919|nr:hypothetical protein [Syntrophothermus sp.]NSW84487.1 hypothetical protein [Syntrophothermus sp.]